MSENRGIFSLEEFYDLQVSGETTNIFQVFRYVNVAIPSAPAFGYLAGGRSTGDNYLTAVDRIDYGNDTATAAPKGNLDDGGNIAGTGNQSFGYTAGLKSQCNRIDYSSDTATAVQKGTLSSARTYISAVGNRNFGYWCGGTLPKTSFIDRLDYSNDTAATTPKGPLSISTLASAGTGNSDFGYIGGLRPGESRTLRIDYSNDTAVTTEKGALIASGYMVAAAGNSDFGYWNSGSHGTRVGRLDYANDSVNALFRGNTSYGGVKRAGTGSGSFGYFTGGDPAPQTSIIDRVDYSNDTSISAKGNLSLGKYYHAGVSAQENGLSTVPIPATRTETHSLQGTDYGYNGGGYIPQAPNRISLVDRIDYSNDTAAAAVKGPLSVGRNSVSGISNVNYGYVAGGLRNNPTGDATLVDRIDYGNDTATASPKGNLSATRHSGCPVGNNNYGYIAGGKVGGTNNSTSVDRIDYSSDTSTASVKGPLTVGDFFHQAGTGNQSSGYITSGTSNGDGYTQGSTIQKIDYSNDTATASPKGNLEHAMSRTAATGNSNYGYVGGGQQLGSRTYMQRIDYSSDTGTTSPKGALVLAKYIHSATSSTTHGYFSAGKSPASPSNGWSNTDRIDYSNDTATAVDKSPLSAARAYHAGTSSRDYGNPTGVQQIVDKGADGYTTQQAGPAYAYGMGGPHYPGGPNTTSTVQRVDYGNDTATAVVKGPLSVVRKNQGGAGNASYGYNAGGHDSSFNGYSSTDRIDYASDSSTASPKGTLTFSKAVAASVSNDSYGWFGGGNPSPVVSSIDRLDFSNDTATASPKGPMTSAKTSMGEAGNASYGYFTGGGPSTVSSVDRIDYSNDSATASPKGPLSSARDALVGFGNMNYGYFGGAYTSPPQTTIDRIDYANDTATASTKGPLNEGKRFSEGTSSASGYGYAIGGNPGSVPSTTGISRVEFANDTATALSKGTLSAARAYYATVSAQDGGISGTPTFIPRIRWVDSASPAAASVAGPAFAYWTGGDNGNNVFFSTVDRVDYSNDTATAVAKGSLDENKRGGGGVSSISYGYVAGGRFQPSSNDSSKVSRIDYANDTATATPVGNLASISNFSSAVGNTSYGYVNIGITPSGTTKIERIDYSSDSSTASPKGNLDVVRMYLGAAGNQSYGYWGGGFGPGYSGPHSTVQRIEYASDTSTASPKGPLSYTRNALSAASNASYVYFGGGFNPVSSQVSRIDISNDTATAATKGPLNTGRFALEATGTTSFGYFGGGRPTSSTVGSVVDRIDYSNDTATASPKGPLSAARRYCPTVSALANAFPQTTTAAIAAPVQPPFPYPEQLYNPATSKQHGYWACGQNRNPSPTTLGFSSVDRLDFSNDTTAASPKGNASFAYANLQSVANASYGYITGGYTDHPPAGRQSSINRLDFANDTADLTVTGITPSDTLNSSGIYLGWGVGNASYGYWGGNYPGSSRIFRLDYSNDTSAPLISGKSISFSYGSAAGNQDYGWIGGVGHPLPSGGSRVERLDYSNDTNNTVTRGPLSSVRYDGAASSNASYGWWGGGKNGSPAYSYVDRITFASDTSTATPKGNLDYATSNNQGTGDTNYGYFGGGGPAFSARSYIQRIDYSNDTATTSPKGPLSVPRDGSTAFSAAANAMP